MKVAAILGLGCKGLHSLSLLQCEKGQEVGFQCFQEEIGLQCKTDLEIGFVVAFKVQKAWENPNWREEDTFSLRRGKQTGNGGSFPAKRDAI